MTQEPITEHSGRQRVSLTISQRLLEEAKAFGVNLSQAGEKGIAAALKKHREEQWLKDNAEAIAAYNKRIETNGLSFKPIWETPQKEDKQ